MTSTLETCADASARPASPSAGDTVYQEDTKQIIVWDGSAWRVYDSAGSGGAYSNSASVEFDGTNDYMQLDSELTFTGEFTFSFWIKPISGNEGFISTGSSGASGPWVDWYGSAYGNKLVVDGMGSISGAVDSMTAGSWYHAAVIRDSSNGVKAYLNGSQIGSSSSFSGTAEFEYFAARAGPATHLNGNLDEIAFWDSDQTSNLATIYNSGAPADLSGLSPTNWYRMGDVNSSSGTTITDQGSGGVDGELINGPTYSTDVPS